MWTNLSIVDIIIVSFSIITFVFDLFIFRPWFSLSSANSCALAHMVYWRTWVCRQRSEDGTYIWMSFHICACVHDWRDLRRPINFDPVPEYPNNLHCRLAFVRARVHANRVTYIPNWLSMSWKSGDIFNTVILMGDCIKSDLERVRKKNRKKSKYRKNWRRLIVNVVREKRKKKHNRNGNHGQLDHPWRQWYQDNNNKMRSDPSLSWAAQIDKQNTSTKLNCWQFLYKS